MTRTYPTHSEPTISVVTPAFNAEATIERAVRSVAGQTRAVVEHLVIEDGSADATLKILRTLESEFAHLKVVARERNSGAGHARNTGIELARGKYIAFLDSDDVWSKDKLEHQVSFMEQQEVQFSYGDYLVTNAFGEIYGCYRAPERLTYDDLLRACPVGCLTAAYNQHALGKVYMPSMRRGQDWGLWLALTRRGLVGRKYPGIAALYLQRTGSLSKNKLRKMVDMYRIYYAEEKLGAFRSLQYLLAHSSYVARKRPLDIGGVDTTAFTQMRHASSR